MESHGIAGRMLAQASSLLRQQHIWPTYTPWPFSQEKRQTDADKRPGNIQ